MFDPKTYFENLTEKLKITKDNQYKFVTVSGLASLEGILSNRKTAKNFVAIDDSENGTTLRGNSGGYFDRRPYTVFIVSATKFGNTNTRYTLLEQHRSIFRKFMSQIIFDRAQANFNLREFDPNRIPYYEIEGMFGGGCVGIWFMVYVDNPINLVRNATDWY